jgi:hypothetical protein
MSMVFIKEQEVQMLLSYTGISPAPNVLRKTESYRVGTRIKMYPHAAPLVEECCGLM